MRPQTVPQTVIWHGGEPVIVFIVIIVEITTVNIVTMDFTRYQTPRWQPQNNILFVIVAEKHGLV